MIAALVLSLALATVDGVDGGVDVERAPHFYRPASSTTTSTTTTANPQRIVSLAPVVTETLYALGVSDRVVGVTRFCDRPPEAQQKHSVGGYTDASLEDILSLKPDLVIAMPSLGQRQLLDRLRDHGVAVFVAFTDSFAEEEAMIAAVGAVVSRDDDARALVAEQGRVFDGVRARAAARGVSAVVVVGHDPIFVAGRGSFADAALRMTGATSAIAERDPQWPQWSVEALLARHVDVVVAAEGDAAAAALRRQLAPLGSRAPRVVAAPSAILMRPGPSFKDDALVLEQLLAPTKTP